MVAGVTLGDRPRLFFPWGIWGFGSGGHWSLDEARGEGRRWFLLGVEWRPVSDGVPLSEEGTLRGKVCVPSSKAAGAPGSRQHGGVFREGPRLHLSCCCDHLPLAVWAFSSGSVPGGCWLLKGLKLGIIPAGFVKEGKKSQIQRQASLFLQGL